MNLPNLDGLKHEFLGDIILPGDDDYEQARSVFMHEGSPAVVLRPLTVTDVVSAVSYARDNSLVLSVRSGGHSGPGFGTNTDGVAIDLSAMNDVEVIDADNQIVRIQAGATWGEVSQKLKDHHLGISSGDTKSVGVGGLTLGGGIGWMVRKYGLTIDSLVAAELVTAEGKILRVSNSKNPDLFWAIRGGGGNFGIVTHFEFKAQSLGKVYAGMIQYGLDKAKEVLTGWREIMRNAPEELTSSLIVMPSLGGNPASIMIMCCYAGDDKVQAMKAIEPLKNLGHVLQENILLKDYADVLEEAHPPQGVVVIAKNTFVKDFSDELIDTIAGLYGETSGPILQIRSLGGAMKRVADDATAFAHRQSEIFLLAAVFVPAEATQAVLNEATKPWQTLVGFGQGAYLNLTSSSSADDIASAYPQETYERLAKIKRQYDPKNLFNQNYNIKPSE